MQMAPGSANSRILLAWVTGPLRAPLLVASYSLIFCVSSLLALVIRFDLNIPPEFLQRWAYSLIWVIAVKLAILAAFGQFRSLLTFFSFPDAKMIFAGLGAAAIVQLAAWFVSGGDGMIPRGTIVVDLFFRFSESAGCESL